MRFNGIEDKYRAFYVVLQSRKFGDALKRVGEYNNLLESLLIQHLELAPKREHLRRATCNLKRIQEHASCLFQIVQDVQTCNCVGEQRSFLRSDPGPDPRIIESTEPFPNVPNVAETKFEMLFALKRKIPNPNGSWVWYSSSASISDTNPSCNLRTLTNGGQLENMQLTLRTCADDVNKSITFQQRNKHHVCLRTRRNGSASIPEQVMVPLSALFQRNDPREDRLVKTVPAQLDRRGRWVLAVNVASSVLQMCHTPWLRDDWSKCDLLVDAPGLGSSINRVYLSKNLGSQIAPEAFRRDLLLGVVRNEVLFTLGLVLVELCLGQTLEDIRVSEEPSSAPSFLTYWKLARERLINVYNEGGAVYKDVVRRCIFCDFDTDQATLDDENFRQRAWNGVVTPLKEGLRDLW